MRKVYLVGAGPGDPELLTVKALRVLRESNVVLHDDLVTQDILSWIPASAVVKNVGKRRRKKLICQEEINALMIAHAIAGRLVVRLKGGDPLIFGRAGEEIEALRRAGIPFEVVPGVTAALAAAAAARISLTDRRYAGKLLFLSGRRAAESLCEYKDRAVPPGLTVVLYMPGEEYSRIARQLIDAGFDAATPCAIVSGAATEFEQIGRTTLGSLHETASYPAPALLIVGEVAAQADLPGHATTRPRRGSAGEFASTLAGKTGLFLPD